ncbi:unnamed protein product, partial [Prorocentrum cordatum]
SADGGVRVWGAERWQPLGEPQAAGGGEAAVALAWGDGPSACALAAVCPGGTVLVWREAAPQQWQLAHRCAVRGPAAALAFASSHYGCELAVGGGGGEVVVLTRRETAGRSIQPAGEQWQRRAFVAHDGDVLALSWAPSTSPATMAAGPAAARAALHGPRRMVTAGADRRVRVWRYDEKAGSWSMAQELCDGLGSQVIRSVTWRPNMGIPASLVAACTEEGTVTTWVQDMEGQAWRQQLSWQVPGPARRLAWSEAGTLLAVAVGEAGGLLFK